MRDDLSLNILRLLTGLILFLAIWYWLRMTLKWSGILLFISPVFWVIGICYPLLAIKFGLVVLLLLKLKNNLAISLVAAIGLVIFFNLAVLNNKPAIFNKLSFKDAQVEVNNRFVAEDSLKTKIVLPLWWRRVSNNKYFLTYKEVMGEVLPFFDLESLFFQEITPTGQKSIVMFFWPEIFILIIGIYFWNKNNNKLKTSFLLGLMTLALIDFVFSEGSKFSRLYLAMLPLSLVLASGISGLMNQRWLIWVMTVVLIYAFGLNLVDLNIRMDYWLDNRPLAFQFWYTNLAKLDLKKYDKIQISSIVGESDRYCNYYLGNRCKDKKFVFESFDLRNQTKIDKGIYAGFAGEFVGSSFKNDVSRNWIEVAGGMGLRLVDKISLRDTIAYKFGNDIGLLIKD